MARRAVRRRAAFSPAELLRLKNEVVRLIRDAGHSIASAQRALHLHKAWVRYHTDRDGEFLSRVESARLEVTPASSWQSAFILSRRRGKSRVESLDEVRELHPDLTATQVELEIEENAVFRAELLDLQQRSRWEIEDALERRAKKTSSDARLVLSRDPGGRVLPGDSVHGSPIPSHSVDTLDLGAGWISPEIESEEAAVLEGKPYGRRHLTDGDHLRVLKIPRPGGAATN